jgi:uncharacterized membrane protein YqjE
MPDSNPARPNLIASLKGLADTFVAILQNRLQLFAFEARQEMARATTIAVAGIVLLMLAFMSLLVITALFLAAFWEERVWVLLAFSIIYLGGVAAAGLLIKRRLQPPIFGETIAQLKKDRQCLLHPK